MIEHLIHLPGLYGALDEVVPTPFYRLGLLAVQSAALKLAVSERLHVCPNLATHGPSDRRVLTMPRRLTNEHKPRVDFALYAKQFGQEDSLVITAIADCNASVFPYTELPAEAGIKSSIGSKDDSYYSVLAETINERAS